MCFSVAYFLHVTKRVGIRLVMFFFHFFTFQSIAPAPNQAQVGKSRKENLYGLEMDQELSIYKYTNVHKCLFTIPLRWEPLSSF